MSLFAYAEAQGKRQGKIRCFLGGKSQNISIISEKTMQNDGTKRVIYNLFTVY